MPGRGIDFILPSDYDKLVVARQTEMAHIDEQLMAIRKAVSEDERIRLVRDLHLYVSNRRSCLAVADAAVQR